MVADNGDSAAGFSVQIDVENELIKLLMCQIFWCPRLVN